MKTPGTEYERIRRQEMRNYCIKWCIFLVCFIVIIAALLRTVAKVERKKCHTRYADFQPEYVDAMTGCMITVDEQRVPAESLRMTL